jgi:hypothetical protein
VLEARINRKVRTKLTLAWQCHRRSRSGVQEQSMSSQ